MPIILFIIYKTSTQTQITFVPYSQDILRACFTFEVLCTLYVHAHVSYHRSPQQQQTWPMHALQPPLLSYDIYWLESL